MSESGFNKWVAIIILSVILITVGPLMVVWAILHLESYYAMAAIIFLIILWGVASGYKDWVISKRQEEDREKKNQSKSS